MKINVRIVVCRHPINYRAISTELLTLHAEVRQCYLFTSSVRGVIPHTKFVEIRPEILLRKRSIFVTGQKAHRSRHIRCSRGKWGCRLRCGAETAAVFYPGTFWGEFPPPNFEFPPKNLRRGLLLCECNTCKLTECSKLTTKLSLAARAYRFILKHTILYRHKFIPIADGVWSWHNVDFTSAFTSHQFPISRNFCNTCRSL